MARIINNHNLIMLGAVVLTVGALSSPFAKIRWSTLQVTPNADMLSAGRFVADADVLWTLDDFDIADQLYSQRVSVGLSEWVNLDVGHADGFTMGFKANILKEVDDKLIPTVTLGMQNLFRSRHSYYFSGDGGRLSSNEFYLVAAKSSEWAKLRGHVGILSAMSYENRKDRFNPFIGFEKYLGQGLYLTLEAQRSGGEALISAFAVYRFVADRMEFNIGVIDALGVSRGDPKEPRPIRPLARAGFRFYFGSGYNTFDGLTGVEDRIDRHRDTVKALNRRIDTLSEELRWAAQQIHALKGYSEDRREERALVIEELTRLRNLYDQEAFDPEPVKNTVERLSDRKEYMIPHLRVIITDPDVPIRIRTLAASLIGIWQDRASADVLISMLTRFEEPSLKIEIIVALGKMKETRAKSVLAALRTDSDTGVAFAATEIYKSLFGDEEEPKAKEPEEPAWPFGEEPTDNTVPERRIKR